MVAMGGDVIVDSAVSGDVLVMGGSVVSDGEIRGKLRMMGGEVINRAAVLGSLLAVGGDVELDAVSRIAGGARLAGARLMVDGIIGDDLEALGRRITVAGEIAGDTTLRGVKITILESAKIGGNLTYESGQEADIHPDAGDRGRCHLHPLGNASARGRARDVRVRRRMAGLRRQPHAARDSAGLAASELHD